MSRVMDWDGKTLPDEMRSLPPGRYVVEAVSPASALTADEDAGLEEAISAVNAGEKGLSLDDVRQSIRPLLKR